MADDPKKSLEMRVAELEDKLSKIHITEDEMKAYHKVSGLLGTGAGVAPCAHAASPCVAAQAPSACVAAAPSGAAHACIISDCIQQNCVSGCWTECRGCVIRACCVIRQCAIFQQAGTFNPGGGGFSGGGFGSLGG